MTEHPLRPLTEGTIVLAGIKASNMPEEIKTHPRVIVWDSQDEHWFGKDLPANVRAVFVTRWIAHDAFDHILKQTRARHITLFNQVGTGVIARKVKELLNMNQSKFNPAEFDVLNADYEPVVVNSVRPTVEVTTMSETEHGLKKLHAFLPHVDWTKSNAENARNIIGLVPNVQTTLMSLTNYIGQERRKNSKPASPDAFRGIGRGKKPTVKATTPSDDIAVQMIDKLVNDLHDLRAYFVAMTKENAKMRTKLDKFKKFFED